MKGVFFLFEANPPEKVEQELSPREMTQQELALKIESFFGDLSYRKISYHNDRKEILLQFDYPDSQDEDTFLKKAEAFAALTGWNARISPSMNHNAAALLLSMLLGDKITKISYFAEKKCYTVTLCDSVDIEGQGNPGTATSYKKAAEQFFVTTGWNLVINGQPASGSDVSIAQETSREDFFYPENSCAETAEQNLAFFCIDQTFESLPHRPEKKSLKQDTHGKYLEIAFISPMIGHRYIEELQTISNQTGWRICISDRVNQNGLLKNAQLLCLKYGISLAKSPSYLPEQKAIQIKLRAEVPAEIQEKISAAFIDLTGCKCTFIG